jgi:predicted metal-dependent peptidase
MDDASLPTLQWPTEEDQEAKKKARSAWEADRAWLVFHAPFMASLAMHLEIVPVVDCRLPTAATDGTRVFVNPYFLFGLSDEERVFVLAHEVWHCALLHMTRRGDREPLLWNLAIDHEVNALLQDEGLTMPGDAVYFRNSHGQNAETVYEELEAAVEAKLPSRGDRADDHLEPGHTLESTDGKIDPDYGPFVDPEAVKRWPARVVAAAQQRERAKGTLPAS